LCELSAIVGIVYIKEDKDGVDITTAIKAAEGGRRNDREWHDFPEWYATPPILPEGREERIDTSLFPPTETYVVWDTVQGRELEIVQPKFAPEGVDGNGGLRVDVGDHGSDGTHDRRSD